MHMKALLKLKLFLSLCLHLSSSYFCSQKSRIILHVCWRERAGGRGCVYVENKFACFWLISASSYSIFICVKELPIRFCFLLFHVVRLECFFASVQFGHRRFEYNCSHSQIIICVWCSRSLVIYHMLCKRLQLLCSKYFMDLVEGCVDKQQLNWMVCACACACMCVCIHLFFNRTHSITFDAFGMPFFLLLFMFSSIWIDANERNLCLVKWNIYRRMQKTMPLCGCIHLMKFTCVYMCVRFTLCSNGFYH